MVPNSGKLAHIRWTPKVPLSKIEHSTRSYHRASKGPMYWRDRDHVTSKSGSTQHSPTETLTVQMVCITGQGSCDAGVTVRG